MRRHRAVLVAALAAVTSMGAIALVAPTDTHLEPVAAPSTARDDSTSIGSTSAASTSITSPSLAPPSRAVETTSGRTEEAGVPALAVAPTAPAPLDVVSPVDVPAGAEPLAVDVSPDAAQSPVATGPEAAAWFDDAPPEVREEIAANVDVDVDELAETFASDPSVFLSADGMVGYTEPALLDAAGTVPDAGVDATLDASAAPADVFALHSLPSSTKVVYLDFDGHVMDGEYWNSSYSVGRFVNQPYDIDGDPTSFSDTERARMIEIWQRVADDYAPFDVDVTTEDPGIEGLRRSSPTDTTFGTRTVITSSDWFAPANGGRRIGGIALVNVFTASTDHASYVFSSNLAGGNAKSVAEASSHEAGHTFSLRHDGTATADYYGGHNSWGPIMGTPYSRAVSHWSNGQYPGANNTGQDDLTEIGLRGGVRTDDHGNDAGSATAVATGTHSGLIGVGGDVDVFRVAPGSGSTRVTVTGGTNATNLLARMTVRDADGEVVVAIDPASVTGWSLSTVVPATAGPFTVEVAGSAWLTPETGFVTYGSLGAYTLELADVAPPSTTSTSSSSTSSTTSTSSSTTTSIAPSTTSSTSTTSTSSTTSSTTSTSTTTTTVAPPPPPPPGTPAAPPSPPTAAPAPNGLAMTAIPPQRVVDTRSALGGQVRQPAGGIVRVPVAGRLGIPGDARAVVANITLVQPDAPGFATVYPCTPQVPDVSVLNHATAQTVANNTIAMLSGAGELCVFTSAGADILVDVTGWLGASASSRLVPLGPSRNVDTRSGLGGSRRVTAGSTTRFDLSAALPPRSTAIALNLTAVTPEAAGFLTAYPCGRARPDTSSLNFAAGETRPNNAVVATDDGSICVYADTSTDILIDVTGAFGPNGLGLVAVDPVRLLDTRRGVPFSAAEIRSFSSLGSKLAPFTPRSASVNVTALDQPAPGFVSTFDCVTLRDTSTLNPAPATVSANGAIVPLADGDRSCLMSSSGGNLIVDLTGWWVP
jgi:hypothetical protein